jgi:hypothetical protein
MAWKAMRRQDMQSLPELMPSSHSDSFLSAAKRYTAALESTRFSHRPL